MRGENICDICKKMMKWEEYEDQYNTGGPYCHVACLEKECEEQEREEQCGIGLHRYAESITLLDKSPGLEKNNAVAWDDRGLAEAGLGDHKGAIPYYNKALALNRTDEYAMYSTWEHMIATRERMEIRSLRWDIHINLSIVLGFMMAIR